MLQISPCPIFCLFITILCWKFNSTYGSQGQARGYGVGFGPEGPGSILNATKDPRVYVLVKSVVLKVLWSVFSNLPWILSLEKIFPPLLRRIKIAKVEFDGPATVIRSQSPTTIYGPRFSRDVPLCLNFYHNATWGLAFKWHKTTTVL